MTILAILAGAYALAIPVTLAFCRGARRGDEIARDVRASRKDTAS